MKEQTPIPRSIRSYVKREGRLTKSQSHALEHYWQKYGIDYQQNTLDFDVLFKRHAPVIMDIGVGTGDSTIQHALLHPENNYIAIEVHRPGVGQLLNRIEKSGLTNIRIINRDVIDVLQYQIPDQSLSQVFIFFPDPWPKKRHHKRRLINTALITTLKKRLVQYGRLHIATDWEDYAEHIHLLCDNETGLINLGTKQGLCPRPVWRPNTRYENRGVKLEHRVFDFCLGLQG